MNSSEEKTVAFGYEGKYFLGNIAGDFGCL